MNRADSSGSPHKFGDASATLYLMRVNMTAKVIANLKTARKLLGNIGISRKKIKEVDLTTDFTLRDKILQKVGRNRQFPLIFIDNQPIGDIDDLNAWIEEQTSQSSDQTPNEKVKDPSHILATPSSPSPFIQFNENIQTESQTGQFPQRIMQNQNLNFHTQNQLNTLPTSPFTEVSLNEEFSDSGDEQPPKNSPRLSFTQQQQQQQQQSRNRSGSDTERKQQHVHVPSRQHQNVIPIQQNDSIIWDYMPMESKKRIPFGSTNNNNNNQNVDNVQNLQPSLSPRTSPSLSSPPSLSPRSQSSTSSFSSSKQPNIEDNKQKEIEEAKTRMNLLGRALGSVEGVVSSLWSWWSKSTTSSSTETTATSSSSSSSSSSPSPQNNETNAESVEYIVIQTNWYWRQQIRILRFDSMGFSRLHPTTRAIRGFHSYNTVKSVSKYNNQFFVLSYEDGTEEYFESPKTNEIISILTEKAKQMKHHIVIVEITDSSNK